MYFEANCRQTRSIPRPLCDSRASCFSFEVTCYGASRKEFFGHEKLTCLRDVASLTPRSLVTRTGKHVNEQNPFLKKLTGFGYHTWENFGNLYQNMWIFRLLLPSSPETWTKQYIGHNARTKVDHQKLRDRPGPYSYRTAPGPNSGCVRLSGVVGSSS